MKIKAETLFILSVCAAVLSAVQSLTNVELYLAGTQWMMVAIALGIYAIYLKKS